MRNRAVLVLAVALSPAFASDCARRAPEADAPRAAEVADTLRPMNESAETFVKLALAVGAHDPDYVDAFYGPPEWRKEAESTKRPLDALASEAAALLAKLRAVPEPSEDLLRLRRTFLTRNAEALATRIEMLRGKRFSFDEESRALYDAVAPVLGEEHFRAAREELAAALPSGRGPLIERYESWRKDFTIPKDKVDATFRAAIAECRERTGRHLALPPGESFTVEYVTGKSWSAYNWYKGGYRSVIQVNTDLPITIERALDLACHEGYPGHHVFQALREKNLVRDRGWAEHSVYPLFSPASLISEGSANFGVEVAFPGSERLAYEKAALFPVAGLDPARAEEYERVRRIVEKVAYAGNEAARRYLNGEIDAVAAARWLTEYALMSRERAEQRVRFFDQYRSYVINYNLGKDMVAGYIEKKAGTDPAMRWQEFATLLSSPRLPSGLR
jgi:hypothetical protein